MRAAATDSGGRAAEGRTRTPSLADRARARSRKRTRTSSPFREAREAHFFLIVDNKHMRGVRFVWVVVVDVLFVK